MSPILQLLLEIAILISAAKAAGLLAVRLGQPAVLGEMLAGVILGPSLINLPAWPLLSDPHLSETISHLAEIGVVLLMFLAGLEADLAQMRKAGKVVLLAGVLGVVVPFIGGAAASLPFGFGWKAAAGIGLLLTATSVSISAQTLLELGKLRTKEGIALLGAAVVDDVLVILLLSVFIAVATGTGGGALAVILLLVRMILFLGIFGGLGWIIIPRFLAKVHQLPISEGVVAAAVVLAFFYAWAAEYLGSIAMITGAFMAGIFAARSSAHRAVFEGISALTYGVFVPLFFMSIGLQADIWALHGSQLVFVLVISVIAILSKLLGAGLGAMAGGFARSEAFRLGIGMISRGEVGLIVAALLVQSGVLGAELITVAVLVVLITTLVTPPMLRASFREGVQNG